MHTRIRTEADSRWYAGHFPGDPILPGIAQLQMVRELISGASQEKLSLAALSRVKFRKIVRPGETLDIQVADGNKDNRYTFRIMRGDEEVCSGMITLRPSATTTESS